MTGVARLRGLEGNRCCHVGSARVSGVRAETVALYRRFGSLSVARGGRQRGLLQRLLNSMKGGPRLGPNFLYSAKDGVRVKSGFVAGCGMAVLSVTSIAVKGGI